MQIREDLRGPREKTGIGLRLRVLLGIGAAMMISLVGTLLLCVIGCLTFFRARRFYSEVVVRSMTRAGLWCCGLRLVEHRDFPLSGSQTVYISNHTSSLDFLVVTSLGLPRTRYFLSGFLRRVIPIGVIGYIMGVFWTASQDFPEKRRLLFQQAERTLRRTGESVFLTPEGQQIGRFNKGAFHLATNLAAPIQPIYVDIPSDIDPGPWLRDKKLDLRPGQVDVYFGPLIDTSSWTLEDLESNRDSVRDLYAQWKDQLRTVIRSGEGTEATEGD